MTDRASSIEKAARAMYEQIEVSHNGVKTTWEAAGKFKRETYCRHAGIALDAICPPGEAWIAPHEPTDTMLSVGHLECRRDASESIFAAEQCWAAMRDAFLSDKGKG